MEGNTNRGRLDEEITVYVPINFSTQQLNVRRYCPIAILKTLIRTPGIAENILELSISGKHLEDDKLVADYDIENHSRLDVDLSSGMEVYVRMTPENYIRLHVKNSMTIRSIKVLIQEMEAIPCEQQTLIFDRNALNDTLTLSACRIIAKSTLYMVVQEKDETQILIKFPEGEVAEFDVKTWYTIWDLKTMIMSKKKTPQKILRLVYDGEKLKDNLILADYNISGKYVLKLNYLMNIYSMKIHFESCDGVFSLKLCSSDDVFDVKTKVEEKIGLRIYYQRLIFNGRGLTDGVTLRDYNIQDGSTLRIVRNMRAS